VPAGFEGWQAPLWPGQLTVLARRAPIPPATMGDILAVLGLGEDGAVRAMIGAWERILSAARPDVVVAEFAPGLMLAAFGRLPLLGLGTGFSLPPAHFDRFPSLTRKPTVHEEARLLETVNAALAAHGLDRRTSLPGIFAADRELASVFTELDPYRPWRQADVGVPAAFMSPELAGGGDELFVYMNGSQPRPNAFWQGLLRSGLKVRIYDPVLSRADVDTLTRAGLTVEPRPVPFEAIAERSRLVLSHCGLGFVSSALLAGLPQILMPYDIEKRMIAASVLGMGLGRRATLERLEAEPFAALLRSAFEDADLIARARAAAPGFRARMVATAEQEAADAAEALLA
jgi:rhamnosyltransferase subunit B